MRIVLDIETNLTFDKIWCVVTRDIDTGMVSTFTSPDNLQQYLNDADKIIMHNGIFFDAEKLQKRGTAVSGTGTYQRYQCRACGTWSQGTKAVKPSVEIKGV